jgi:hypothetical protein
MLKVQLKIVLRERTLLILRVSLARKTILVPLQTRKFRFCLTEGTLTSIAEALPPLLKTKHITTQHNMIKKQCNLSCKRGQRKIQLINHLAPYLLKTVAALAGCLCDFERPKLVVQRN